MKNTQWLYNIAVVRVHSLFNSQDVRFLAVRTIAIHCCTACLTYTVNFIIMDFRRPPKSPLCPSPKSVVSKLGYGHFATLILQYSFTLLVLIYPLS